jgi:Holliday junction DNA helicase RuvB
MEYIGQTRVKENLSVVIQAAQKRGEALDAWYCLYGPPGLGKTTLQNIIAAEMGFNIRTTQGRQLKGRRPGRTPDFPRAAGCSVYDVIHRLSRTAEKCFIQRWKIAVGYMIGKGPSAGPLSFVIYHPFTPDRSHNTGQGSLHHH